MQHDDYVTTLCYAGCWRIAMLYVSYAPRVTVATTYGAGVISDAIAAPAIAHYAAIRAAVATLMLRYASGNTSVTHNKMLKKALPIRARYKSVR